MESIGYAGRILRVDLSSRRVDALPTSDYVDRFLGGRGIATRLYWDHVPPKAQALAPENALVLATGPLAGVPVIGGSRLFVCGKSPATSPEHFSYCNMGGDWAVRLKSAGYDLLFVQGKADKPVYLLINDGKAELKDASALWGKGAIQARETLTAELGGEVSVVAIGPAGENQATMACLIASDDAAGGAGMGAVMGSKNLKAIVVRGPRKRTKAARPEKLDELTKHFRRIITPSPMATAGGLALRITGPRSKKAPCYGCMGDCLRWDYQSKDGQQGKFMCQSATFYQPMAEAHYGKDYEVPFQANKLCDEYGLDTMAVTLIIIWLIRCAKDGILTDESTGIPISKVGTAAFIETLVRKIALREGFGDVLAQGVESAAEHVGPAAVQKLTPFLSKAGLPNAIDARLYPMVWLPLAMEPKLPLGHTHEITRLVLRWIQWRRGDKDSYVSNEVIRRIARRFWGSEAAGDLSGTEGMALAAKMVQDREYAEDCLVLCGFLWPMMDSQFTEDHMGDPSLASQLLSAVTGRDVDEDGLNEIGERVFNLNRAVLVREGHRGAEDDRLPDAWHTTPLRFDLTNPEMLLPGKGNEAVSMKGRVVDKVQFEAMKREYYQLRKWGAVTGLPTESRLKELGIEDVAAELKQRNLIQQ
jgi:aldehyde:ferredoxin oxidoreductase